MKNFWSNIHIRTRLLITLTSGFVLLALQYNYYHFLLMIAGMVLVMIAFFSLQHAPALKYKPEDRGTLFLFPMILISLVSIPGFYFTRNIVATVCIIMFAAGLYTVTIRRILLNFGGYKVYEGIYAIVGGLVFMIISGFVLLMIWPQSRQAG